MAITPNTVVHFLNVPLENNYKNQIYFADRNAQTTFMLSKKAKSLDGNVLTFENLTYQRKDNVIRVPLHIDQLVNINYVMYQNSSYTNRWFYAFVTKMDYVNDGRTDVHIETDVWQTWFDKVTLKESFVEREHVKDDTVGLHTIPEDLNVGQLISDRTTKDYSLFNNSGWYWLVFACNYNPENGNRMYGISCYNGYPQGCVWFAFLISPLAEQDGLETATDWVYEICKDGKDEYIQDMFVVPYQLIDPDIVGDDHKVKSVVNVEPFSNKTTLSKSGFRQFSDYDAKNNKLYTYPYSFIRATNNMGCYNDYKIEDFHEPSITDEGVETDNATFELVATPCIGVSAKTRPMYYQGVELNEDESLQLGKYPTLSWSSDAFTNWMTQNAVNLGFDIVGTAISASTNIVGGLASGTVGGAIGGIGSGASNVVSGMGRTIGAVHQAGMLPNTAKGNANAGDVSFNHNLNMIKFLHMRPKKEYLQMIDNFFEMWGYKVNTVKVPTLNNRPHWTFIKTISVNLDGSVPQEDLKRIRMMFDDGVTFWNDGNNVENYSLNNH